MVSSHTVRVLANISLGLAFALAPQLSLADSYGQIDLVSDVPGLAHTTDPNLVNPWGVAFFPTSPFWISNQGSGTSTLYDGIGTKIPLTVPIPAGATPPSGPTGQVFSGGAGFLLPGTATGTDFIFDTLNGTLVGWGGPGTQTQLASTPGAIYTGLALASNNGSKYLYAADSTGQIRVFNSSYTQVSLPGSFTDPNAVAGYVPFNIQLIGSNLYVTYAELTAMGTAAPGSNGYVDVFNTAGQFQSRLATGGALFAPWGITLAPAGFGPFGNDLLIGNFGNGQINAYSPVTNTWLGTLDDGNGNPIVNDFLWSLDFRTGGSNVNTDALYFTAGINNQTDGLFGAIELVPEPNLTALVLLGLGGLAVFGRRAKRAS
jgi:uncharacterized protein (TIGR03118 family)